MDPPRPDTLTQGVRSPDRQVAAFSALEVASGGQSRRGPEVCVPASSPRPSCFPRCEQPGTRNPFQKFCRPGESELPAALRAPSPQVPAHVGSSWLRGSSWRRWRRGAVDEAQPEEDAKPGEAGGAPGRSLPGRGERHGRLQGLA